MPGGTVPMRRTARGRTDTLVRVNRDDVLDACSRLPGAVEDHPFGDGVAVFKVGGKMFALVPLEDTAETVNLKCEPDRALELRAQYAAVRPGYHQNKRHWNTIDLDGTVPDDELRDLVEHSCELVCDKLPRAERDRLRPT